MAQKIAKNITVEAHNDRIRQLFSDTLERLRGKSEEEIIALRKDPSIFLDGYLLPVPEVAPEKMNLKQLKAKLTHLGLPIEDKDGKKLRKNDLLDNLLKHLAADVEVPRQDDDIPEADVEVPEADVEVPEADVEVPSPKKKRGKNKGKTVKQLKEELASYGLSTKGKKGELQARLDDHLKNDDGVGVGLPDEANIPDEANNEANDEANGEANKEPKDDQGMDELQEILVKEIKALNESDFELDDSVLVEYDVDGVPYRLNPETNQLYDPADILVATYDEDEQSIQWISPQFAELHEKYVASQ